MSTQTTGLTLLTVGATLLWSPWALVLIGMLLVVVPEVVAAARQRRARISYVQARVQDGQATVLPT